MVEVRPLSFVDQLIVNFDQGIRILFTSVVSTRPNPSETISEATLTSAERSHIAGLMRVDHVGEVCAQALYQGQAITARDAVIKENLQQAASEEKDHLVWCEQRLNELNSHTSYLNPVWYIGSLSLGIMAGLAGDKWSLGFVAETERQVVKHLENHLQELPDQDKKSRAVLEQMCRDEAHHATLAVATGATELPAPIKHTMRLLAKVMTTVAYYL